MKARIVTLLAVPFLLHAVLFASIVYFEDPLDLSWLDLGVLGLSLAWVVAFLALSRGGRSPALFVFGSWIAILVLLVGEAVVRWRFPEPTPGLPWPQMAVHSVAADTMPGVSGPISFTTNRLGLRGPEVNLDEMDLRILCVGASDTQCRYVTDRASWPWKLQDDLAERLDRRVFVGNAARGAMMVAEFEMLLREYRHAPRFDRVIALCGIYDACVHLAGNYRGRLIQSDDQRLIPEPPPVPWNAYYRRSAVVRVVREWHEERNREDVQDAAGQWYAEARRQRREALQGTVRDEPPDELPQMLEVYRQDVRNLIAACGELKVKPLLLTQPTRFGPNLPADVLDTFIVKQPEVIYTPAAYAKIIDEFNRALLEVAEEEGADCIDLAAQLSGDPTLYYDEFHFNTAGCARVAEILEEFFADTAAQATSSPEAP